MVRNCSDSIQQAFPVLPPPVTAAAWYTFSIQRPDKPFPGHIAEVTADEYERIKKVIAWRRVIFFAGIIILYV
ncbi:MAG: hypothetical protein GYA41_09400 [Bacteroidales bacterium]|nr:hypothetical protein [Bacteroidales bacterium]